MSDYEIRAEAEVPGTPEQVWDAIATGPGITSWFMPTKMDGDEGSEIVFGHAEGFSATGKVHLVGAARDEPAWQAWLGEALAPG